MSVYAPIYKGRYDAKLNWPFIKKITFTLLEGKNHHQMTPEVTAANNAQVRKPGWGFHKFVPHSELGYNPDKYTQYLKDDTIFQDVS